MTSTRSSRPYLFNRLYAVGVAFLWNYVGLVVYADSFPPSWLVLILAIVVFPALFMLSSLLAFRWDYCAFGRRERTSAPFEGLVVEGLGGGLVGWFAATWPFITWSVFESGLGLSIWGAGDAFVPLPQIERVEPRLLRGCTVWHRSPEVRSPVVIRSTPIAAELERFVGESNARGPSLAPPVRRPAARGNRRDSR